MTDIKIEVDDKEVKELLGRLQKKISDMTPVFQTIGDIVKTSVIKNFETGGRYSTVGSWRGGTKKWQPLSIATLFAGKNSKWATKRGRFKKGVDEKLANRRILIGPGRTGTRLMNEINYQASKDKVTVGTNAIYAAIHNFGGPAGRGKKVNIPARPFLVIQDEDMAEIKRAVNNYLTEGVK